MRWIKKISYYIKEYFEFSQKEVNAFMLISTCTCFLLFLPYLYELLSYKEFTVSSSDLSKLDSLSALLQTYYDSASQNESDFAEYPNLDYKKKNTAPVFHRTVINPNNATVEQWMQLGLPRYLAERINKYIQKGGKFYQKKDLLKIYGMTTTLYEKTEPFLYIPHTMQPERSQHAYDSFNTKPNSSVLSININTADTNALIKLRGIGSKRAARIVKYRDKLGGFVSEEQFKEIFGMDSVALSSLINETYIEQNFIPKKININTATYEELSQHPYIGKTYAKILDSYRHQHGTFNSLEALDNIRGIDPTALKKIKWYITL